MNMWVFSHGEMLPSEPNYRPMRTGMLTAELARRGHRVTWWTSTFSHRRRQLLADRDTVMNVHDRLQLRMLHAGSYRSTISLARHLHNLRLGRRLAAHVSSMPRPDVILASYPIIEFADAAVRYGRSLNVPALVDVRDFWPDLYLERLPKASRGLARAALGSTFRRARRTLSNADALVAMSDGVLRFALNHASRDRREHDRVFPIGCRRDHGATSSANRPDCLSADPDVLTCTFVGTFGYSYDIETVLRAADRLRRSAGSAVEIVIVGAGQKAGAISAAAAGLPNVRLTGWLAGEDVDAVLRHSDVGLMPIVSRPDAMPNKFFEYLRSGLAIISSLEGEVEHVIRDQGLGLSYRVGDDASLAHALTQLAAARDTTVAMGRRSRALFEARYVAETIYSAFADHLEFLASQGGAMRPSVLAA
jgi:glycosyltransferase involved in cell wall biosynthesis